MYSGPCLFSSSQLFNTRGWRIIYDFLSLVVFINVKKPTLTWLLNRLMILIHLFFFHVSGFNYLPRWTVLSNIYLFYEKKILLRPWACVIPPIVSLKKVRNIVEDCIKNVKKNAIGLCCSTSRLRETSEKDYRRLHEECKAKMLQVVLFYLFFSLFFFRSTKWWLSYCYIANLIDLQIQFEEPSLQCMVTLFLWLG